MKKLAVLSLLLFVSFGFADPQRPTLPGGDAVKPRALTVDNSSWLCAKSTLQPHKFSRRKVDVKFWTDFSVANESDKIS